jgi:hypothetical protein
MKEQWVLSIRGQRAAAKIPFLKHWGGTRKKAAGRMLRGRTYDGFPSRVKNPSLPAALRQLRAREIESAALVQMQI